MGRRIVALILIVVVVVAAIYAYRHYQVKKELASGETTCVGCMTPEEKARFDKQNAGEAVDAEDARPVTRPIMKNAGAPPTVAANSTAQPVATVIGEPAPAASMPTTDTVPANPPNGMVFSGKGTYQWYRQGNLTWRVDTSSGRSCIIYATMEEWRKKIVMSHGCGRDA